MFKKKLIAMGLTVAMVGSLVACGAKEENNDTPTPTTASSSDGSKTTPAASGIQNASDDHSSIAADSIVSFEDGNFSFATYNDADWTGDDDGVVSVASKFDSQVLHVTRPNGGNPAVAIDLVSLLGDNAEKCAKITLDVGVDCGDTFSAISGSVIVYAGETNTEIETSWSLYKADAAMKTVTIDLGGNVLTADASNYLTFSDVEDAAATPSALCVDNIIFYDADGNALPVDSSVDFAVVGVGEYDWSNGVKQPTDEVLLFAGVQTGSGWWPDNANSFAFTQNDAVQYFDPSEYEFGPGKVLTIYYSVADLENTEPYQAYPYIRMQNWNNYDEEGNEIDLPDWPTSVIVDVSYSGGDKWGADYTPNLFKEGYEFLYDNATQTDIGLVKENEDDKGVPAETVLINQSYTIVQYSYEYFCYAIEACGLFQDGDLTVDDWMSVADFIGIADRGSVLKINAVTIGTAAE